MVIVMENVKTTNGRCHVGQTREQALKEGRKTVKWFSKLDTDRDGVLSFDEVIQQRTERKKALAFGGNFVGLWALIKCYHGIVIEKSSLQTSDKIRHFMKVLLFAGSAIASRVAKEKIEKQNSSYSTQYQQLLTQQEQDRKTKQLEEEIEQIQKIQQTEECSHEIETDA